MYKKIFIFLILLFGLFFNQNSFASTYVGDVSGTFKGIYNGLYDTRFSTELVTDGASSYYKKLYVKYYSFTGSLLYDRVFGEYIYAYDTIIPTTIFETNSYKYFVKYFTWQYKSGYTRGVIIYYINKANGDFGDFGDFYLQTADDTSDDYTPNDGLFFYKNKIIFGNYELDLLNHIVGTGSIIANTANELVRDKYYRILKDSNNDYSIGLYTNGNNIKQISILDNDLVNITDFATDTNSIYNFNYIGYLISKSFFSYNQNIYNDNGTGYNLIGSGFLDFYDELNNKLYIVDNNYIKNYINIENGNFIIPLTSYILSGDNVIISYASGSSLYYDIDLISNIGNNILIPDTGTSEGYTGTTTIDNGGTTSGDSSSLIDIPCPVTEYNASSLTFSVPFTDISFEPFSSFSCIFGVIKEQFSPIDGSSFSGFLDLSGSNKLDYIPVEQSQYNSFNNIKIGDFIIIIIFLTIIFKYLRNRQNG